MTDDVGEVSSPATNRRYIGRRFLALRKRANLTRKEVADALDVSSTTLGRIETGSHSVRFKQHEVRRILEHYGAAPDELEVLLALAAETRSNGHKSWWQDQTDTSIPDWFSLYVQLEDSAETIRQYEPELVPGLLQTRSYAEQVILVATAGDHEETDRLVAVRMERQGLLRRPRAPQLEVILNEAVLHRIAGSQAIARAQLQHLVDVSQQSNVIIRMLPYSAGIHGGMTVSGEFTLLRHPVDPLTGEPFEPPSVYVDFLTGAIYLSKPAEVAIYDRVWEDMSAKASTPEATRLAIINILEGLPQ